MISFFLTWTPLIASTDFDGVKADTMTTVTGIIAVILAIMAGLIIIKLIKNF